MSEENLGIIANGGTILQQIYSIVSALNDIKKSSVGIIRVYGFKVFNSEKPYKLHGYAKDLMIHNSGASDVMISFPNSSSEYYTIPSGDNNANPLPIRGIKNKTVNKLLMRSAGVESRVEVVAMLWEGEVD